MSKDHVADHDKLKEIAAGGAHDPGAARDLLTSNLILHMGAFHGWNVARDGGSVGMTIPAVGHDLAHGGDDVLDVYSIFDEDLQEGIARFRQTVLDRK